MAAYLFIYYLLLWLLYKFNHHQQQQSRGVAAADRLLTVKIKKKSQPVSLAFDHAYVLARPRTAIDVDTTEPHDSNGNFFVF